MPCMNWHAAISSVSRYFYICPSVCAAIVEQTTSGCRNIVAAGLGAAPRMSWYTVRRICPTPKISMRGDFQFLKMEHARIRPLGQGRLWRQHFYADGRTESIGHINPKYGTEPGRCSTRSANYIPLTTKMVNIGGSTSTSACGGLDPIQLIVVDWLHSVELRRLAQAGPTGRPWSRSLHPSARTGASSSSATAPLDWP